MNEVSQPRKQSLESPFLRLEYLIDSGPRLVGLFLTGAKENLLAELPEFSVDTSFGRYHFRGGHRLWHAPEAMPRTYVPDNGGLIVEELDHGVRLSQPTEIGTGIEKRLEIILSKEKAAVTLQHKLVNRGLWPVELAAWAITQLPIMGKVILPQQRGKVDEAGLLPNRQLVLWPYTRWRDARLKLGDEAILIDTSNGGTEEGHPLKIGYYNPMGWIAYWRKQVLFVKGSSVLAGANYPDLGCTHECYCNDQFVELESLGPLTTLQPGEALEHDEVWELYDSLEIPFISEDIRRLIREEAD